jgi:ATP-dependent DNA ligase
VSEAAFLFPMRPTVPRVLPPTPRGFLVQPKYDGWNVVVGGGRVWTRRGNEITGWCADWGFDPAPRHPINGELLAVVEGVVADHAHIQGIRTGRCRPLLVAFDVMVEGPGLEERLAMLPDLAGEGAHVAPTTEPGPTWAEVNLLLEGAKAEGHEGLVLKRRGSLYHPGRHGPVLSEDWLKLKVPAG